MMTKTVVLSPEVKNLNKRSPKSFRFWKTKVYKLGRVELVPKTMFSEVNFNFSKNFLIFQISFLKLNSLNINNFFNIYI